MIKAVIIEDEDYAADRLTMLLGELDDSIEIIALLSSIQEAVQWLMLHSADLIFLDINLADGNAFKIFERVEVRTPIIFTTAYHEYALRAFEQHSIDYLLKPISREKLKNSLDKLKNLRSNKNENDSLTRLKEMMELMQDQKNPKRFLVNVGNRVKVIETPEIACFVSEAKIIFLQTMNGRRYAIDQSLKQIQLSLPSEDFFRVNRQFLLNRQSIRELQYFSSTVLKVLLKIEVEEEIVVAREKIGASKRWLVG